MILDISVIFTYFNEEDTIKDTLSFISNQTYMPKEVFFVNSSSQDKTSEIIDNWLAENGYLYKTKFYNVFEKTSTPSSSKNIGIKRSTGNWLAFMDCGLIFELDWLESQWNFLKDNKLEVVSGNVFLTGKGSVDQAAAAQTYGLKRLRPCIPSTIVKKTIFEKTGYFLSNRRAGYDIAWPLILKKLNIIRGINKKVVLKYNGVNFGNNLRSILIKKIVYTMSTVAIKYHYLPYYFVAVLIVLIISILKIPSIIPTVILIYFLFRGYIIPIKKSKGILFFKSNPYLIFWLPIVGLIMDIGGSIGIICGMFKYHILKKFFS